MDKINIVNPLFEFQSLCDIDIGLYRLIKRDYYDRTVFNNILFDSDDERFIKAKLICRRNINPLFLFCKKGKLHVEELDDLYQQFLVEEYDNILKLSTPTSIASLASVSNSINKLVDVTILCKTKKEEEWIKSKNPKLKCLVSDYKELDISKYDTIYLKDIYDLLLLKKESVYMKNIVLSRYLFNLENTSNLIQLPLIEVSKNFKNCNRFMLIDVYKDITIPVSEMV